MSRSVKCYGRAIDAHFKGKSNQAQETSMREHLLHCEECRDYYRRKLLLAEMDPSGLDSRTRLAQGLNATRRVLVLRPLAIAASVCVAVFCVVLWQGVGNSEEADTFVVRGDESSKETDQLLIYRVSSQAQPTIADKEISADDELAFAYVNIHAKKYLLIYGVDEHGRIFWYHPEWVSPENDPPARQISSSEGIHELPEAIRHPLSGSMLRIVAIFTDQRLTAKQVESMLRGEEDLEKTISATGAIRVVRKFIVRH